MTLRFRKKNLKMGSGEKQFDALYWSGYDMEYKDQ